jgi:hypothetical protein
MSAYRQDDDAKENFTQLKPQMKKNTKKKGGASLFWQKKTGVDKACRLL